MEKITIRHKKETLSTYVEFVYVIYQVLHLLLKFGHGFLGAHSEHKSVHVLVIKSHFDLLQTNRQML